MIKKDSFRPTNEIVGDSPDDTRLLQEMANTARRYMQSFKWCPPIKEQWFADGVGGLVAIFLFEFEVPISREDNELWVIVGDIPSAYLVTDSITPGAALAEYCRMMDAWIHAVRRKSNLSYVFPVGSTPTEQNAQALETRLRFIRSEILPSIS